MYLIEMRGYMRWENKGHEFDKIGKRFEDINRIYIYGITKEGTSAAILLKGIGADVIFVDRNKAIQGQYMDIDVISPEQMDICDNGFIIVLSMGLYNTGIILKKLELSGFLM